MTTRKSTSLVPDDGGLHHQQPFSFQQHREEKLVCFASSQQRLFCSARSLQAAGEDDGLIAIII